MTQTIMNKTELVNAISEKAGLTKAQSKDALDAVIASISEALVANDKVALIGFGTFSVAEKAARTGVNPATKQKIEIPARKVVKFKAGSELTDAVK
ncbi:MAG: HU family DNA-binding protein [Muribaculaceae bacterium]|nr:HU family DNA-binding protein [Muribaculaceae bacterium]